MKKEIIMKIELLEDEIDFLTNFPTSTPSKFNERISALKLGVLILKQNLIQKKKH